MATVSVFTLGCRLNQFESDSISGRLIGRGHKLVSFGERCDVAIVNSCTVTARADRKSRQAVYRALKHAGQVLVTGCYADNPERYLPADRRIRLVGNALKAGIPALIDAAGQDAGPGPRSGPGPDSGGGPRSGPGQSPAGGGTFPPPTAGFRSRGMLKIQDGCDQVCAYCIVSRVRGPSRSVPVAVVLREVRQLLESGFHEVVLTGVNVGDYRDGTVDLTGLLEQILGLDDGFRLRLTSLEPDQLTPRLVEAFRNPRLCPHLHLALQSGSDDVLTAMRRGYAVEEVRRHAGSLRSFDPLFNLTADVIVGFPGETQADFEATVRLVEELELGHVHVFPFSQRPGTAAGSDHFSGRQLSGPEIRRRSARLRRVAQRSALAYRDKLLGSIENVLIERIDACASTAEGYGEHYVRVRMGADERQGSIAPGTVIPARLSRVLREGPIEGRLTDGRP